MNSGYFIVIVKPSKIKKYNNVKEMLERVFLFFIFAVQKLWPPIEKMSYTLCGFNDHDHSQKQSCHKKPTLLMLLKYFYIVV